MKKRIWLLSWFIWALKMGACVYASICVARAPKDAHEALVALLCLIVVLDVGK